MRRMILAAALLAGCSYEPAKFAAPQANYCVPKDRWPALLALMRDFGAAHGLKLIGSSEQIGMGDHDRELLNAALAQGYNYYFGDDMDIWLTSDPFRPEVVYAAAVVRKEATPTQRALAQGFMNRLAKFAPRAHQGADGMPSCTGDNTAKPAAR